jgi:hypothetical protein
VAANLGFDILSTTKIITIFYSVATICGLYLNRSFIKEEAREIKIPLAAMLFSALPIIFLTARSNLHLGMSSSMNNDIASYAASTRAFITSGWNDFGMISGINLNEFVHYSSPFGSTGIMTLVSVAMNLKVYEITLPVILLALFMFLLGVTQLFTLLHSSVLKKYYLPTLIIVGNAPILSYIFTNYFLNQVFGVGFSLYSICAVLNLCNNRVKSKIDFLQLALSISLGIYFYPTIFIPFFGMVFGILTCFLIFQKSQSLNFRTYLQIGCASLIGILFASPYLDIAFGILKSQSSAIAGWPLVSLNPFAILLFPQLIGIEFSSILVFISWMGVTLGLQWIYQKSKSREKTREIFLIYLVTPVATVFIFALYSNLGIQDYKIWKLITFFLPIILTAILPIIFSSLKKGTAVATIFATITAMSPMTEWTMAQDRSTILKRDLVELSSNQDLKNMQTLNVRLNNYFESMAVASVLAKQKLFMNSFTYWPQSNDPNACILIRNDSKHTEVIVVRLNSTYSLVSPSSERCF